MKYEAGTPDTIYGKKVWGLAQERLNPKLLTLDLNYLSRYQGLVTASFLDLVASLMPSVVMVAR